MLPFEAGDKTLLIEVLHPKNDHLQIGYSLAHASLEVGQSSLPHILNKCSEAYYILKGEGRIIVDQEATNVKENDVIVVPAGATQYVENTGIDKLEFLCIVSPAWFPEQEEIL